MKNLTQLPGSGKGSKAKNDNTLSRMRGGIKSRIGSMSLKNTSLFGVILTLLLTFGVGEMWGATYYYRGNQNSWGATAMTVSTDGFYEYFSAKGYTNNGSKNQIFKVSKSTSTWDYNNSCMSSGFNSTNITNMGNWDSDNICIYNSANFYILVYYPNTCLNTTTSPKVCASTTLPEEKFYLAGTKESGWLTEDWSATSDTYKMTKSGSSYSITVSNVSGGNNTHVFKVSTYNWKNDWGHSAYSAASNNNVVSEANSEGNVQFKPAMDGGTVTITFNSTTSKISIVCQAPVITFDKEEGSGGTDSQNTYYNEATSNITAPTRTGYTFGGYYTGDDGTGTQVITNTGAWKKNISNYTDNSSTAKWIVRANHTLHAKWTAKTYSITLDDNGDYQGNGSATATYGSTALDVSDHASRTSWNLTGYWTASGSGGSQVSDASGNLIASVDGYTDSNGKWIKDADCSLYAHWSQTNSLTVSAGTHVTTVSGSTSPVTLGNSYSISATAFATGYEFNNWTADPVANGSFASSTSSTTTVTVSNGSVTVTANAKPTTYSITYAGMDGATNFAGAPSSYTIETATIELGTPTKAHYKFAGWKLGGSSVTSIPSGSTGNKTLTATWTALPKVYLKNTMNWANAYVTFYKGAYFDGTNGAGSDRESGNYVNDPTAMTYNSSTGLFEYECPDIYTYTYACFTKVKQDDYNNFWKTEGVYCNDNLVYDSKMVVVEHETTTTKNETKYYTAVSLETYAVGTGWFIPGGWSSWETKGNEFSWNSTNVRFTKSLSANTNYEFKIYNCGVYYGNSGTYSASGSKTFTSGASNCTLSTTLAGTYTFDFNPSTKSLTITYPEVYAISGGFNSWTEETNLAFTGNDGTYSVTITGSSTNYEFKVIDNAVWYGHANKTFTATESNVSLATGSNNIKLKADVYPNGSYTFAYNKSTHKLGVTYPTNYVVTFGKRTGGSTVTAKINNTTAFTTGTKIKPSTSVTFAQTALSGYTFEGWYNNSTGGTRLSTSSSYTTTVNAATTVYSNYTANHYTVSFNVNGGTASTPDSKEVTFGSAYGELPSGMTHASKVFKGWYTESSGGSLVTASTIVSTASNHTLYAQYESIYEVNVNFKCGDDVLYPATKVTASPSALTPTIIAPEILGYEFVNWTGTNVTPANPSKDTTTITATASTTITANYNAVPTVYFKNNLGWDSVFVTFDCGFNAGKQNVPSNNGKPYYLMKQLGATDIFYCAIPETYTSSNYASWAWNIAFDNSNYGGTGTTTHTGTWDAFWKGEFIGRSDFDPKATMYIPFNGDTETRNSGTYYRTGCWMKYNSTESGYQVNVNKMVTGSNADTLTVKLTAPVAGSYEFSATVNLKSPGYGYGFKLYKLYQKNTNQLWYSNKGSIHSNTTDLPWEFATKIGDEDVTATTQRCELYTEAIGDYKITVSFATGKPIVDVEYPVSVGDWRLAYNDRVAWSGSAHAADWYLYSRVIKAKANAEDIVSFYVSKAAGASAHVELQKCTAIDGSGNETWTKQGSNLNISAITETGIYNFKVTQNGSKVASAAYDGSYDGNFYIRTDASDGGWTNYITSGKNLMTYSEYAEENHDFTHYFMRYVTKGSNIKFCIANDYSPCLTEYCIDDNYTSEWIEANGNVRFMWDHRTNAVSRAYISGSSIVSDRFLVLEGDAKMFNASGTALTTAAGGKVTGLNEYEMNFTDDQNWIYEATVKAQPGARVKLTAKYNNKIQYFYGDEGTTAADSVLLLGGNEASSNKYKIRVVYDFKTNRLIKAFIPDGTIGEDLKIEADLMIIREAQENAQQINFTGSGKLSEVKTVYGAMKFNKYTVNDKNKEGGHDKLNWSRYKRDLFYISFPFDVKLSDVFGFGTYGKHWIIEYYDGKERAANGFWAETETFWKFVMPSQRHDFTLKANEGYILALDLDELTESSSVWNNGVEDVYVYFPSNGDIDNIYATEKTVTIDQTGYECTIGPRPGMSDDRRVKDSYWHVIGAPSFANYGSVLKDGKGGSTIDWSDSDGEIDWTTPSLPYLYEWNSADNTLSVTRTATFTFKAMYSYMVQYAGTSIYWSSVNAVVPSPVAPRKMDNTPTDVEFRLELQQGEQNADQTFIRLSSDEHVTTGYDFNYDLSKEFNGGKANIYTMITSVTDNQASLTEAAGNVLPMSEQTTVVPVGVKITMDGDYTFSIPEGTEGVGVTLLDTETGIRTSLSALDYTVSLEAGTYNDRFLLEISPIQHIATDVESTGNDAMNGVRKLLIDGLLYIVRDGKMFDARGARVE